MRPNAELRQLLVDAAAALEELTDGLDESADEGRRIAGELRDAAFEIATT